MSSRCLAVRREHEISRSPLLARRGGRDIKKVAKHPILERTGWLFWKLNHHPRCTFGAAAPPGQEG